MAGLFATLVAVLLVPGSALTLEVQVEGGRLEGRCDPKTEVCRWLGIPYAAPPVNDMRWRPPQSAAPWSGVRSATKFGSKCLQTVEKGFDGSEASVRSHTKGRSRALL